MNPIYDFAGQTAVVTGGSSGMGLATARAFAEAGAAVVIADINETTLGTAANELTAAGHRVLGVRCDVSEEDSVAAMVKTTVEAFGRLDFASTMPASRFHRATPPTNPPTSSTGSMRSTCAGCGPA